MASLNEEGMAHRYALLYQVRNKVLHESLCAFLLRLVMSRLTSRRRYVSY